MFRNTGFALPGFDMEEYKKSLAEFLKEYEIRSTPFENPNYKGHMLWDICRAHFDAYVKTLKYNQNIVAVEAAPFACELETKFIEEFASDIGYPEEAWGYLSSGGTVSNIYGLWVARNKQQAKGKKAEYVLVGDDYHYSIQKACNLLGLRVKPLRKDTDVPPDEIAAVICICGCTEFGACDDILYWREFCDKHDIHLHVDAAYGGYYVFCKDSEYLTEGARVMLNNIHLADSITIDVHKTGYAPFALGVCLIKNREDVLYINSEKDVKYLGVTTTSLYTLEGSRPGSMAAAAYFGHKCLKPHYKEILEMNLIGAKRLREKILGSKYFTLYEASDMAQVCFTSKVLPMRRLMDTFCIIGNVRNDRIELITTNLHGVDYFRICVMDPTFKDTIDAWWEKLESTVAEVEKNYMSEMTSAVQSE